MPEDQVQFTNPRYTFIWDAKKVIDFLATLNSSLTVRSYHVTYAFQSESTLYS